MLTEQQDQDIRRLIISGWTHARIQHFMRMLYDIEVAAEDIDTIQGVVSDLMLPPSALQKRFNGLDIEVDPIGEMHRVLRVASDRLGAALNLEAAAKDGRLPYTDTAIKAYWRLLAEFIEIQQSIGVLPRETTPTAVFPPLVTSPQKLPTIRALMVARFDDPEEQLDENYARGSQVNTRVLDQKLLTG